MKSVIIIGTLIPLAVYLCFIAMVFGVTGFHTTPEGIVGLNTALGNGIIKLGYLFGIIATFTSFITLGITLKKSFFYDWRLPEFLSWALAVFPAFILYLAGLKDFIGIIGFIGSIMLGFDIIMIFMVYLAARKKTQRIPAFKLTISSGWILVLIILFLMGIIAEIIKILFHL